MQSNHLDIYRMVAEETGKDEQMYKDLGSFIFKETARLLKEPTSLILKLKGIGSWHLRKKRMEIVVNEWTDRAKVKTREDFTADASYEEYLQKHLQYLNFQQRLLEYDKYLAIKQEVRKKRNETQTLLESDKGEDESQEPS